MARIKDKHTKPEMLLRRALWEQGLRYRMHHAIEKIRPDIVFTAKKVAIFVDGCQWHGCPEHYVFPRTNQEFWANKLKKNTERDIKQTNALISAGWTPIRFWEHEIWSNISGVIDTIVDVLSTGNKPSIGNWRLIEIQIIDPEFDIEQRRCVMLESPIVERITQQKRSTKKWTRHESLNR
jgi:DNA mismatch endonuclease (patch repair protein)